MNVNEVVKAGVLAAVVQIQVWAILQWREILKDTGIS
jgi:hypothetical protein